MTGARTLVGEFLRRDRWMFLWWSLGAAALYYSQAVSVDDLYPTQADFDRAAASMANNTAFIAMAGPARALNTIGGQVTWQASAFGAVVAGLMSMFIVGRHTRGEEESGRDELLRAAPVARHAPMTAAVVVALAANVLLGLLVAVSLISYPLAVQDSIALGVGLTLCGWAFTGTALLAAQVTASTRSMYGIAGTVIGLAYALRAIGDVGNPVLSWLSPIGWYQAMHPFSGVRWWPALFLLAAAAAATAAGYATFDRRDFASGVVPARPGPDRAARSLRMGWGLAWRLHRGPVLGWAAGLLFTGVAYGSIGNDVDDLIGDSKASQELFVQAQGDLVDSFYATAILMLAIITAAFAISSAMRPRTEEDSGRVEPLLSTALSRRRWLLGHLAVTAVGTVLVMLVAGLGVGAGFALVTGDGAALGKYTLTALPYAAPALVLSGFGQLLYGIAPRTVGLAWLGLAYCSVVMLFGDVFQIPQWLQDASPFEHLALVPAQSFRWAPFVELLAVAIALAAAGLLAFERRDVR
jgi:ABC-2 type transport system permease protein